MEVPQSVLVKIQKLLNLKEGAEAVGSFAEMQNAATRVQELLMKYNLDLEDLRKASIDKKAEMFDEWINLSDKQKKTESFWVPKLYGAIARNNLCYVNVSERGVHIIGEKQNVEMVLYISEQMISKIRIAEKMAWKKYDNEVEDYWDKEKKGTFKRGFFTGAARGINQRLQREKEEMEKEANKFALMIINKKKVVDDYLEETYYAPRREAKEKQEAEDKANGIKRKVVRIRYSKGPRELSSTVGHAKGYDAGLQMNINKGVDHKQTKGHLNE